MEADRLDRVERALAGRDYGEVSDAEFMKGMAARTVLKVDTWFGVSAVWDRRGRVGTHMFGPGGVSGIVDATRGPDGQLTIVHRESGLKIYDGDGVGFAKRDNIAFIDDTLFLDPEGLDREREELAADGIRPAGFLHPASTAEEVLLERAFAMVPPDAEATVRGRTVAEIGTRFSAAGVEDLAAQLQVLETEVVDLRVRVAVLEKAR